MSKEVRLYEPWSGRFREDYPSADQMNVAAHGSQSTPHEKLARRGGNGSDDADEIEEDGDADDKDLVLMKKILKRRKDLHAAVKDYLSGKESLSPGEEREYARLMEERRHLYARLGLVPPEEHNAHHYAVMEALANEMIGPKLVKGSANKETRDRRQAARAIFGLGKSRLREMGALPPRSGWI
jgi:hypothetical protein